MHGPCVCLCGVVSVNCAGGLSPTFSLSPPCLSVSVSVSTSHFHHQLAAPSCARLSPRLESRLAGRSAARARFSVSSFQEICNSDERTEERYGDTWYLASCWWKRGRAAPNIRRFGAKEEESSNGTNLKMWVRKSSDKQVQEQFHLQNKHALNVSVNILTQTSKKKPAVVSWWTPGVKVKLCPWPSWPHVHIITALCSGCNWQLVAHKSFWPLDKSSWGPLVYGLQTSTWVMPQRGAGFLLHRGPVIMALQTVEDDGRASTTKLFRALLGTWYLHQSDILWCLCEYESMSRTVSDTMIRTKLKILQ